jgi:uncharacterized protein
MTKKILIAGGTGNIGQVLEKLLVEKGHEVFILTRRKTNEKNLVYWDVEKKEIEIEKLKEIQVVINLVGAGIADENWSEARKKVLIESRTTTTNFLFEVFNKNNIQLDAYLGASAIGYYGGVTSDKIFTEEDVAGNDFLADICKQWEQSHNLFSKISSQFYIARIGVVLTKTGGALEKMAAPVKLFAGAALGSGKQIIPWIHVDDLINIFHFLIEKNAPNGVYNAVSPNAVSNKTLTKYIAKTLKKPLILPNVPSFALKFALGEMSIIVLEGSEVSAEKTIDSGYAFKYSLVEDALADLL